MKIYDWTRVYGDTVGRAIFRQELEDFKVEEELRFPLSGSGAHHFLFIEKRNINTDMVCKKLQSFAQVKSTDVGYAGKKDRFAVAMQWFSVQLPLLKEIDWSDFNDEYIKVLKHSRHEKKLRVGAVKKNHFTINLHRFDGDKGALESRLNQIKEKGFANYFGEQRFGYNGDNLAKAEALLSSNKRMKNRNLQGILLSSARAFLFNHVLSQRIKSDNFDRLLNGDYVILDGSESGFVVDSSEHEMERYKKNDIHPTAPLPGRGREQVTSECLQLEVKALADYHNIIEKLVNKGVSGDRRAIRVFPSNLSYQWRNNSLELAFSLTKGSFATSLLRELVELIPAKIGLSNNH